MYPLLPDAVRDIHFPEEIPYVPQNLENVNCLARYQGVLHEPPTNETPLSFNPLNLLMLRVVLFLQEFRKGKGFRWYMK